MQHSESIAKLAEALAKAQGVMEGAIKDSSNPFFKSKYADLASVWEACRKPLSDNGLSVIQTMDYIPEAPETVCVETVLCHTSGEWIKGKLAVKPVKADPQSVGSCITYLRRYSLQSMVGIAPEDDDGNAASGNTEPKEKTKNISYIKKADKETMAAFREDHKNTEGDIPEAIEQETTPLAPSSQEISVISPAQGKRLFAIANQSGVLPDSIKLFLKHFYNIEHSKDIPKDKYEEIIDVISSKAKFDAMMEKVL